jgi:energy-coupling factor transport system ATP-binding protein
MRIEVKNLSYVYMRNTPFEKKALDDVSLIIEDGEFAGLIGHTGCGKTTLIQHFNALLRPSEGSVSIDGKDIKDTDTKTLRDHVGLVFQYPEHQLFEETVYKDIAFGIKGRGYDSDTVDKKVHEVIRLVGLEENILQKSVFDISGGQKRRAAIAGVLVMEPSVLVLDEPAAGLDPSGRDSLYKILTDLHEEKKITVVFVSHNMEDVALLCSKVIVMNEGHICMTGSVDEIFKKSGELYDIGLDVPQITKFMQTLNTEIPELNGDVFRIEDAKQELLRFFGVGKCLET